MTMRRSLAVAAVALSAEIASAWQQHGSQAAAGRGRVRGAKTPFGFGRGLRSMVTDEVSETEMRGTDAAPSTTTEEALDDWFNAMSTRNLVKPVSDTLNAKRAAGAEFLSTLPRPTRRMEPWRYSDLKGMFSTDYASPSASHGLSMADVEPYFLEGSEGARLVFVDGAWDESLSDCSKILDEGVAVGGMSSMGGDDTVTTMLDYLPELMGPLPSLPTLPNQPPPGVNKETCTGASIMAALNQACIVDAACVVVPAGVEATSNLQVVFVSTADSAAPSISHPRLLVKAGEGAKLNLTQSMVGIGDGDNHFTNGLTRVVVEKGAEVDHTYVQEACSKAQAYEAMSINVAESGRHTLLAVCLGGAQSRLNYDVVLEEEKSTGEITTILMAGETQISDLHSSITHAAPSTISRQQHRNIVSGRGECVFKGRIKVEQIAQETDSEQLCRTLLLTDRAKVVMMPSLEIIADQVKCTHGATVSDLAGEEIFYLQSRGISVVDARKILISAFVAEMTRNVPCSRTKARIAAAVDLLTPTADSGLNAKYAEYASI